jgi:thiamine biosynthesis lipoprotein
MKTLKKLPRRQFLQMLALGGTAGVGLKLGLDQLRLGRAVSGTRMLMGTVVNITAVSYDTALAEWAISSSFERMQALEYELSRFIPESQLARLNREGRLSGAGPALLELIRQSRSLSELSDGAFDITMKPLLDLYQAKPGTLPAAGQIESALALVDHRQLEVEGDRVSFKQPGMSITLDGIAKGYIVDQVVACFRELGFPNVLVEVGGDLMGLGRSASDSGWKIGLQSPRAVIGSLAARFSIQDRAIATSCDYLQAFTADFMNHHIIDPHSGHSSPELASASVLAPTVALADGLATALMVMGRRGLEVIRTLDGCEAYAITKDLQVLKTSPELTGV